MPSWCLLFLFVNKIYISICGGFCRRSTYKEPFFIPKNLIFTSANCLLVNKVKYHNLLLYLRNRKARIEVLALINGWANFNYNNNNYVETLKEEFRT